MLIKNVYRYSCCIFHGEHSCFQSRITMLGRFQQQLQKSTEATPWVWLAPGQPGVASGEHTTRLVWEARRDRLLIMSIVTAFCSLTPGHSCLDTQRAWLGWESLLNVTACPAGSLPLSTRMTAALCGSLSLWISLLCLTDQFPSRWAGRTFFHLSHGSEVGAGSKPQEGVMINIRKIKH